MENKAKKGVFQKYYGRLMWEGILRSVLCGFVIGFAVQFVLAFALWFATGKLFWVSIVAGVVLGAVFTVAFYFWKFQPTAQSIARRIDRLGLEERLITMNELENDESYIALRQREDAKTQLATVEQNRIKFKVPKQVVVATSVLAFFAVGMTTVDALTDYGIIKTPEKLIEGILPEEPPEYVFLSYLTDGNGFIEGEPDQILLKGETGTVVVAVEDDGWVFVKWSDGIKNPARRDFDVMEDKQVTAEFGMMTEEEGEGEGGGEPGGGAPGENDKPNKNAGEEQQENPGGGIGGKFEEVNWIIDGKTYYRDEYQKYMDDLLKILAEGGDLPPELIEAIKLYFEIIK
jgi:hypothetical protein